MFGETDSQSPRVPSPWDSLISAPPSPASRAQNPTAENIPKLVPEAEEGNIEYKLQLLDPSPARFVRLVTQLKWRLLEGGGQAYYELGVADSGTLVGLPRAELDQSLDTLEMMAGEIGASVIVVKEVEVPAAIAGSAATETDYWNGRRRKRTSNVPPDTSGDSTTENESEVLDVSADHSPGSSPNLIPIAAHAGESNSSNGMAPSALSVDLEIASVFKPLAMRNRNHVHLSHHDSLLAAPPHTQSSSDRIMNPATNDHQIHSSQPLPCSNDTHGLPKSALRGPPATQTKQEAKLLHRSQARDRKRAAKRQCRSARADTDDVGYRPCPSDSVVPDNVPQSNTSLDLFTSPRGRDELHQSASVSIPGLQFNSLVLEDTPPTAGHRNSESPPLVMNPGSVQAGPRFIVEALVVRKMSLDECFLDLSGFSLT